MTGISVTRRALGGAHVPLTKVFRQLTGSVNKTIVKPRVAAAANTYTSDFSRRKILHTSAYTISKKAIRFWHLDYNPDRAQKLISSSISLLNGGLSRLHSVDEDAVLWLTNYGK